MIHLHLEMDVISGMIIIKIILLIFSYFLVSYFLQISSVQDPESGIGEFVLLCFVFFSRREKRIRDTSRSHLTLKKPVIFFQDQPGTHPDRICLIFRYHATTWLEYHNAMHLRVKHRGSK